MAEKPKKTALKLKFQDAALGKAINQIARALNVDITYKMPDADHRTHLLRLEGVEVSPNTSSGLGMVWRPSVEGYDTDDASDQIINGLRDHALKKAWPVHVKRPDTPDHYVTDVYTMTEDRQGNLRFHREKREKRSKSGLLPGTPN